jgi:hypothetical protein
MRSFARVPWAAWLHVHVVPELNVALRGGGGEAAVLAGERLLVAQEGSSIEHRRARHVVLGEDAQPLGARLGRHTPHQSPGGCREGIARVLAALTPPRLGLRFVAAAGSDGFSTLVE